MPTPKVPDLTDSGLTPASYLKLWDDLVRDAMHGALCFHGADSSAASSGAEAIAEMADGILAARIARAVAFKEAAAAKEDES